MIQTLELFDNHSHSLVLLSKNKKKLKLDCVVLSCWRKRLLVFNQARLIRLLSDNGHGTEALLSTVLVLI